MFKKKNIGWFILAFIILLSFFTVRIFISQGEFKTIVAQSRYDCKAVAAPFGPEDMIADYETGLLYISASARPIDGRYAIRGNIHVLDMNSDDMIMSSVTNDFTPKFRPHGISFIKLEDGSKRLFAISHPSEGESRVEIFDVAGKSLSHVKTIEGLTGGLNSLVAIDGERFYTTQDGQFRGISPVVNGVLGLNYGEIIYYDGQESHVVAEGFAYANGIEMSSDGKTLYAADTLGRTLSFYTRDLKSNLLVKSGDLYMDAGIDNIRRNEDGTFLIGGHPKMFSSLFYMAGRKKIAPSVVFHAIPPKDGTGGELHAVYLEEGELMSATSGAVQYKNKMFVASIVGNKILSCTAKN